MRRLVRTLTALAACTVLVGAAREAFATIDKGLRSGDLLLASMAEPNGVNQFRNGALVQSMVSSHGEHRGVSYTASGLVVSTWDVYWDGPSGVSIFNPATGSVTAFQSSNLLLPTDVSVMKNGNFAVNDAWGQDVDIFAPNGLHLKSLTAPPLVGVDKAPLGSAVAPDGSIWVTLARNQDILHFSSAGTYLGGFRPGFNPGDIVVDPTDGTLWFPGVDSNSVYNFTPQGQLISSFSTPFTPNSQSFLAIAMSASRELYVSTGVSTDILRYSRQGTLLATLSNAKHVHGNFMAVVVPEASGILMAVVGGVSSICLRKRGRRR